MSLHLFQGEVIGMIQNVVVLPDVPTREMYIDNQQFDAALEAWGNVCRRVVERSQHVQPPAVPRREHYLNEGQFYQALDVWETVFVGEL